jgi:hypothetical protein
LAGASDHIPNRGVELRAVKLDGCSIIFGQEVDERVELIHHQHLATTDEVIE